MARQWRDPLVGRDILFGVALGALHLAARRRRRLFRSPFSDIRTSPQVRSWRICSARPSVLARTRTTCSTPCSMRCFVVFGMVLLKMIVEARAARLRVAIVLITALAVRGIFDGGPRAINCGRGGAMMTIIVLTSSAARPGRDGGAVPRELHDGVRGGHARLVEVVLRRLAAAHRHSGRARDLRLLRVARRRAAARTATAGLAAD